jgi:hypothetical protein
MTPSAGGAFGQSPTGYACHFHRRRGGSIRTIRIEAPTSSSAELLVHDLVPFAQTDLLPLDGERRPLGGRL